MLCCSSLLSVTLSRILEETEEIMATAQPTKGDIEKRTSVAKPSQEVAVAGGGAGLLADAPSRREFLYYIWGASMVLLLGQLSAGLIWFIFPRFREGEFGGEFAFNPDDLPPVGDAPVSVPAGRFHISMTENGLLALFGVCTHLGCLPRWVPTNVRFECPCHGSKFNADGSWIEGPAPRGLDRFVARVIYSDGTEVSTDAGGGPIPLDPTKTVVDIRVNTGRKILGPGI
jgi:cytochrome b6-f complex iron-sulfur subunit